MMEFSKQLTATVMRKAKDREKCKECPLRSRKIVVCDLVSSGVLTGNCDVLFIGINPGTEEAKEGRPFCGPSGQLLRSTIEEFNKDNLTIGFTNAILCSTPSEASIGDLEYVYSKCKGLSTNVLKRINPKVYAPVGRGATQLIFDILDPITRIAGHHFDINDRHVIPTVHPASVLRGGTSRQAFKEQIREIFSYLHDI